MEHCQSARTDQICCTYCDEQDGEEYNPVSLVLLQSCIRIDDVHTLHCIFNVVCSATASVCYDLARLVGVLSKHPLSAKK